VFNVLLQLMDDGRLTDAKGRTVSFKNTIVVLTSNVGADALQFRTTVGFQSSEEGADRDLRDQAMDALRSAFRPEFLNRIDEIVVFRPLDRAQMGAIVERLLEGTRRKLRGQAVTLEVTPAAVGVLVDRGFEPRYGARPLRRAIQRDLETPISRMMLSGELTEGDLVRADAGEGGLRFDVERREPPRPPTQPERPEAGSGLGTR
jgi:ATP-dependent Clp protease ATP-binding subunit ClpC